ncbi:Histone methylation protein [Phytophthora palmivora]|uniref:Histone-lysine N-methyltransferase, H3 lysine-79 specific n=1 Tax=Phytophthora palmivora TaxID=4796 RepID=A0A2P4YVM7_9STRA|nr:Histone methylation protein [Phytophthora palmivora]
MCTSFSDQEDKKLVVLATEYEIQGLRIVWRDVARKMTGNRPPQQLEMRLRALKRTYGKALARFPPCFFTVAMPSPNYARFRLLDLKDTEVAVRAIFSAITAADVRQQAGRTEEKAGELLPTAISSVIGVIGDVTPNDVFLDVGSGIGNVATQFALQTNAHKCLGIEKRVDIVLKCSACIRSHASQLLLLHKVRLFQGDVMDTLLPTAPTFQDSSIIYLNDFLFDEATKLFVREVLCKAQTLMAISQSRYEGRRRDHAPPQHHLAGESGGSPDGSNGSNSDTGSGDQGNGSGPTGGSGPANPPNGRQPPRITFVPQVPFPEGRCVPGRRIARVMAAADIDPWIESRLENQTVITISVNFLFPIQPFQPDWIFPHRPTILTSPTSPAFCGHLITEANVKTLQASEPWQVMRRFLPPITFETNSTHKFPITTAMIAQSPSVGAFAKRRNNRRSHAGNRWKRMLLTLIQATIKGWCDLDLLLDPFFLYFPNRTDEVAWYPGIEARRANLANPQLNRREPTDLLEALADADTADHWRNHYQDHTADHPAHHLPRLDRKFFGLQVAPPPTSQ